MNSPLLKLFTHPADAWLDIRRAEEDHPSNTCRASWPWH